MAGRVFDRQTDNYHEYRQASRYEYDDGTEVVPLCKPPAYGAPHFVAIRMHAPVGLRRVAGEAIKSGTPPVLPSPGDTPSGDRLMGYNMVVWAPDTRGTRWDQRTFAAEWEMTYAQCSVLPAEYQPVAPAEATVGVARGAVVDALGTRKPLRLQTGRPPYARITVDGLAAALIGLLANFPLVGGALAALIEGVIDATLDRLGRSDDAPALGAADYNEYGVEYRPQYFSDGIIR